MSKYKKNNEYTQYDSFWYNSSKYMILYWAKNGMIYNLQNSNIFFLLKSQKHDRKPLNNRYNNWDIHETSYNENESTSLVTTFCFLASSPNIQKQSLFGRILFILFFKRTWSVCEVETREHSKRGFPFY